MYTKSAYQPVSALTPLCCIRVVEKKQIPILIWPDLELNPWCNTLEVRRHN